MGISKMPLRKYRTREGRIYDNNESSEEEDIDKQMNNDFELLSLIQEERA